MKKLIILIAVILFSCNVLAIDLNLTTSTYGPESVFQGYIRLNSGNYPAGEKITLSSDGNTKQLQLLNLLDCNLLDCSKTFATYTTTSATETSLHAPSILTGLKIRKNSVVEDASFNIAKYDTNLPDTPTIDIGNDGVIEWSYPGYSTDNFGGITLPQISNFEETVITENCQKFTLPKALKYRIKTYVKKTPTSATLDIYIPNIAQDQTGSCQQPSLSSWEEITCNITLSSPLEAGDYYFCLTGSNNILAANSTSLDKKGYIGCSSICTAVNKDYVMNFSSANYITTLNQAITFTNSNTQKDQYGVYIPLMDLINNYLSSCPIQDGYCILPINISSKNNNQIQISNLNYKETTEIGEVLLKHDFLSSVTQEGTSTQIKLNLPVNIQLSNFNFKTPSDLGNYELTADFLSQTDIKPYSVIPGPKPIINVSKNSADILAPIQFSALESKGNSTLTYFWDFDDKTNSTLSTITHAFSKAGTYIVSLTVTDSSDISSTALKAITIGGTTTGPYTSLDQALTLIDEAEAYYNSAPANIKSIYSSLGISTKLTTAKTTLVADETKITEILDSIPKTVTIKDSYEITPFLTTPDINLLLPLQDDSFKEAAQLINEKVVQKINAYSLAINYLSQRNEDFILVTKTINVPEDIPNPVVIDLIPTSLLTSRTEIIYIKPSTAEKTNLNEYQNLRFSVPSLTSKQKNEISYKIISTNLRDISKLKTLILS
ncbi:MAG: PKD domain-containing protein, partial [Nanoarchaeota archaeon]|nr:PKD domain-containing protein [Nanoarchaeota archaeon]